MLMHESMTIPSDVEGRWLAAFGCGRWAARSLHGRWAAHTSGHGAGPFELLQQTYTGDEDDLPEAVSAALALNRHGWLDAGGLLTRDGRAALLTWANDRH